MRLDRVRGLSIGARLAEILANLPEGRDLLGGTGLDLLAAFDALLIATAEPADPRTTVLVARHRLSPADLRVAFDHAAATTNRVLTWRDDARFPFGQRRASIPRPGASPDNRLFILPEPGVVVVTTPAYMRTLFSVPRSDGATPDDDPWRALPHHVDAEAEEPVPAGEFASVTVAGDRSAGIARAGRRARIHRWRPRRPRTGPDRDRRADQRRRCGACGGRLAGFRDKLVATPLLVAADSSAAGNRARLTREGRTIRIEVPVTEAELLRLLQAAATLLGSTAPP